MKRRSAVRAFVGLGLVVCVAVVGLVEKFGLPVSPIPDPPTTPLTLSTGRRIDVIQMGIREGGRRVWDLEYRTRIAMSDTHGLASEVSALWAEMEAQAERADASEALIMPVNFSRRVVFDGWRPIVVSHRSTAFSFEKGADGAWRKGHGWLPGE